MILQACSGHLVGPFFHLSQNVAVMKYIVQSLLWAVNVQVALSLPWRAVWVTFRFRCLCVCLQSFWRLGQFFDIDLTVYWFNPVSLTVGRRAVSGHPLRKKWRQSGSTVFFSVCVCMCVGLKRTTHVIHIPLCLYFSMWMFVGRVGAWLCFTRVFLWKSECASSALAREVKGRWTRWAVPVGQSWTHRYPGRARGYVASIRETSSRSNKGRPATDWLSPSHPPLTVGEEDRGWNLQSNYPSYKKHLTG